MKKIILILFLFFLSVNIICYYIYKKTEDNNKQISAIGDMISNNPYFSRIDTTYTNKECRIIDLLSELQNSNKTNNIHQLLKNTDILIISVGMNDIYYKLNDNSKEIYTYINNMLNTYEEILNIISKYSYQEVYVLGYYNTTNKNTDIFTYANYKLNKIAKSYHYNYLNLDKIIKNNPNYLIKSPNYYLNNRGYYQIYDFIVEKSKKT